MDEELTVKAAVHIHSNWSYDGKWTLSRIANFFSKIGYQLVFTSEHSNTFDNDRWEMYRKACQEVSTDRILIIPGLEYSDQTNTIHILVWGALPFLGINKSIERLIIEVKELNGICVFAHPTRRNAWRNIDPSWIPLFDGIEQWNRKSDGIAPSREAITLLNTYSACMPFVSLDFHQSNQLYPLSMIFRNIGDLSEDNVISALRNKQCCARAFGISVNWFREGVLASLTKSAEQLRNLISKKIRNSS